MTKPTIRAASATRQQFDAMLASTVLLELSFHRFGDKRQTTLDDVAMTTRDNGESKSVELSDDAFQLSRRLLDSSVGREIRSLFNAIARDIKRIALPSLDREGVYRISLGALERAEEILTNGVDALAPLKTAFEETYLNEVAKMRAKQHEKFRERDYPKPEAAAAKWGIEWDYVETGVPASLGSVNSVIYKRACERAEQKAVEQAEGYKQMLRAGLLACVTHLRDGLTKTTKTGKPQAYRAEGLAKFNEYFATFPLKNFLGDVECETLMKQAQSVLASVPTVDVMNDDAEMRAEILKSMTALADSITPLVKDADARSIVLPD